MTAYNCCDLAPQLYLWGYYPNSSVISIHKTNLYFEGITSPLFYTPLIIHHVEGSPFNLSKKIFITDCKSILFVLKLLLSLNIFC